MNNNFSFSPSNSSIYNIQPTFQQQNQMSFLPPGADPQQNHALAQELFAQKNEPSLFAENRMDSQNNKKRRDKGSARIS